MPTKTKQPETQKIPKLRFREFSGAWEEKKLGEICKIKTGSKDTQDRNDDGKYPFFVRSNTVEKINSFSFDGEAILTSGDGVGVGKNFHYMVGKFDYHQRVYCLCSFKEAYYGKFVYNIFTERFYKRVMRLSAKNSVDSIRMDMISAMQIHFPSFQEQQKIAKFLNTVDEWIGNLRAQKQFFEKYKKGIMQKIFSQEVRFRDDKGKDFAEWKKKRLVEVATLITKGTTPTSVGFRFKKEGVNFIKVENVDSNSNIKITETPKISEECDETLKRSKLQENDIMFSIAGTLGRTAIVRKKDLPANTNQAFSLVRLKDGYSIDFVNAYLNLWKIKRYIHRMLSVGAQPNLSLKQVGDISLNFPLLQEQQKIADFLTSIDNLIVSKQQQIIQAETWKKGLMQRLFV